MPVLTAVFSKLEVVLARCNTHTRSRPLLVQRFPSLGFDTGVERARAAKRCDAYGFRDQLAQKCDTGHCV